MEDKAKPSVVKELALGVKVWVTIIDPKTRNELKYMAGEVTKTSITKDFITVKFEDGSKINTELEEVNQFPVAQIALRSEKKQNPDDLIVLKHVNEPEIAATLENRYETDEIYTYCGSTLISVNPYCLFEGEYSTKKKLAYKSNLKSSFFIMNKIPPHVYSMALNSVHEIIYDDTPSSKLSICVGGESGSGKTEASLHCLDFMVFCYNENPEPGSIESRV